jgi:chromosome segregation ATPase
VFENQPEVKIDRQQREKEALQRMSDEIVKAITETKSELEKVSKTKEDLTETEWYLKRKIRDLEVKMERLKSHRRMGD